MVGVIMKKKKRHWLSQRMGHRGQKGVKERGPFSSVGDSGRTKQSHRECQGEAMGAKRDRLGGSGSCIREFRFDPFLIALVSSQWSLLQSHRAMGELKLTSFPRRTQENKI